MTNLVQRSISGIIYVLIIVFAILFSPYTYVILFASVTGMCLWEFYGLLEKKGEAMEDKALATLGGVYVFITGFFWFAGAMNLKYIALWLIIMLYLIIRALYSNDERALRTIAYTFFGQVYIGLPFMFLSRLGFPMDTQGLDNYSPWIILCFFILIWISDTGAYVIGSLFGKHKLFERISPKKSWEGFLGGLFFAVVASFFFPYIFPAHLNSQQWIGFAITTVVFGMFGDLFESLIKRTLSIKDSGNLIPGHGGMLDRFDSSILAAPAAVIYYLFMI